MVKSGAAQNQTVEEILASIRQAISADEAKRRAASAPAKDRGADDPPKPDHVGTLVGHDRDDGDPRPGNPAAAVRDPQMQQVIDLAIERALDGVRAELEAGEDEQQDEPQVAPGPAAEKPNSDPAVAQPRPGRLASPPSDDEPRTQRQLLSPRAGAAVSASFDDLAGSMRPGHVGKVDKVVEGILRPMLQNWLDDNLPTLVERLVREEIERVSRGRRR